MYTTENKLAFSAKIAYNTTMASPEMGAPHQEAVVQEIAPRIEEGRFRLVTRVVISGHPGTGKSRLIDELAYMYDLPPEQKIKVGDLFRAGVLAKTGKQMTGYEERPIQVDLDIDAMQVALLEDTTDLKPFMLESKLGGFLAHESRDRYIAAGRIPPPMVTVLLYGDEAVINERVYLRDRKIKPTLTPEQSEQETRERKQRDGEQWSKAHPELAGIDPLDPINADLYAISIDTTNKTVAEIMEELHNYLFSIGGVEEISPTRIPRQQDLPPAGEIFQAAS